MVPTGSASAAVRCWSLALTLVAACTSGTSGTSNLGDVAVDGATEAADDAAAAAPMVDAGQPACRGPGRYEAGKERSYRPCCSGLHERSSGRYDADQRVCVDLPLNIYGCVQGECGDGACEIGEADPCACPADCLSSSSGDADAGLPDGDPSWITLTSKCGFSFSAPPDLLETDVRGTDSCVVQYAANGCSYSGDYGGFSGSFEGSADQPGFRSVSARIDGQNAMLVSYGPIDTPRAYVAGVHFPSLPAGPGVKLTFIARCETAAQRIVALQVFETLRFPR